MNKSVLILGAYGFIGSALIELFLELGYYVFTVGRGSKNKVFMNKKMVVHLGDNWPCEVDASKLKNIRYIFHCASSGRVADLENQPVDILRSSLTSSESLLPLMKKMPSQSRLIFFSSAAVYGEREKAKSFQDNYVGPCSMYGLEKLMTEQLIRKGAVDFNFKVSIIRLFSIFGPGLKKRVFWEGFERYCELEEDMQPIMFYGNGFEKRDWVDISNLMSFMEWFVCRRSVWGDDIETFDFGSGVETSLKTALEAFFTHFKLKRNILFTGVERGFDPDALVADMQYLNSIGWKQSNCCLTDLQKYGKWCLEQSC